MDHSVSKFLGEYLPTISDDDLYECYIAHIKNPDASTPHTRDELSKEISKRREPRALQELLNVGV